MLQTSEFTIAVTATMLMGLVTVRDADAQSTLRAIPFAFIGTSDECGGPAGSHIVTAAWLGGMGLPDNGGANTTAVDLATNPNKADPHRGLLLSKNGPTPDCSSAGAVIVGFGRGTTLTELGFDYRNGTHCGAGAPRFNITSTLGFTYFAGCAAGIMTPAPQDPLQWTRVRIVAAAQVFPASAGGSSVSLRSRRDAGQPVVDRLRRGDGHAGCRRPARVGLSVLDNIDVNGRLIRSGAGIADGTNLRDEDRDEDENEADHDGHDGDDD